MAKTPVLHTRFLPWGQFAAITILGIIFVRKGQSVNKQLLNHELIHCRQQLEWLYLPFFVIYLSQWLWHLCRLRNTHSAYRAISFEREAYQNQDNPNYLRNRKPYANFRKPAALPSANKPL